METYYIRCKISTYYLIPSIKEYNETSQSDFIKKMKKLRHRGKVQLNIKDTIFRVLTACFATFSPKHCGFLCLLKNYATLILIRLVVTTQLRPSVNCKYLARMTQIISSACHLIIIMLT